MKIKRGDMVVVIGGDQASRTPHRVTQVVNGGKQLLDRGRQSRLQARETRPSEEPARGPSEPRDAD